jgi:hypothetical protein
VKGDLGSSSSRERAPLAYWSACEFVLPFAGATVRMSVSAGNVRGGVSGGGWMVGLMEFNEAYRSACQRLELDGEPF